MYMYISSQTPVIAHTKNVDVKVPAAAHTKKNNTKVQSDAANDKVLTESTKINVIIAGTSQFGRKRKAVECLQ